MAGRFPAFDRTPQSIYREKHDVLAAGESMRGLRATISWLGVVASVVWAGGLTAREPARPTLLRSAQVEPPQISLLPAAYQLRVRQVVELPNLTYHGTAEEFVGKSSLYYWLLDHPDRASHAWRRLGTPCMEIADRGNGRFGWSDDHGSDIWWETLFACADYRVWYAEGKVRPALLLPPVPLRAVVVFHHSQQLDERGKTHIRHQADVFAQTDSKTAGLVLRLMGPSIPHLSEQCISQMGLFFSGLVRYFDRYPERADDLLFGEDQYDWLKIDTKNQD